VNGPHDLGGQQGFGPVVPEANEPVFHHRWEGRACALTIAMGAAGRWTLDQSRFSRERTPPATYLASSYYKIWTEGLTRLLVEQGLATREEIADGAMRTPGAKTKVLAAADVPMVLGRPSSVERPAPQRARFAVGDRVRTRNLHPATHTRLPRYCRDKPGTIVKVHGAHVYPDSNAVGRGEDPQWLYTVRFEARDLWGADTTASAVYVDLWEPYLE
jgi:nitrile hydratase